MIRVDRKRAVQEDIEAAIQFYVTETNDRAAIGFVDAVEAAIETVQPIRSPALSGSVKRAGFPI